MTQGVGSCDCQYSTELFDLLPNFTGKVMIDVGAYSRLEAMVMCYVMSPSHVIIIEPQAVLQW